MANLIECPACRHELQVPPELLGQLVKCPLCSKTFTAPNSILESVAAREPLPLDSPIPSATAETVESPLPAPTPGSTPIRRGFRCPFCGTDAKPVSREQISLAGWIVFAVMIFTCFPLFWIGLLMKEEARFCAECGKKLSGDSL